jgi:putative ABC transport system substrate-binding protein
MRRREFILAGGATIGWPLAAWAQQPKRRIGVLMSTAADDPEGRARYAALVEGLGQLGQTDGRNVQIDTRWPGGDAARGRSAEELVALAPDVIFASGGANVAAL